MNSVVTVEGIQKRIFLLRGQKVMLDVDLAQLYGVTSGRLNEAVKRNRDRFPIDFMFQLTKLEFENLKSHIAISSSEWGGRRHPPFAFTERGVAMLSSVLRSHRAVQGQHYHHAHVRAATRAGRHTQRACDQADRVGAQGRRPRRTHQVALRSNPAVDERAGLAGTQNRIRRKIVRDRQTERASPMNRSFQSVERPRRAVCAAGWK